jgi:putative transposase
MNRKPYPSDLTDEEWRRLEPLVAQWRTSKRGRPREVPVREIINGLLYVTRSGCQWRMLPHDLPPWRDVYDHFDRWRKSGQLAQLHDALRRQVRYEAGRDGQPSAAIIDSQSVKAAEESAVRGYDGGKKITGIKRHIVVDTLGLLLAVVVHSAGIQERDGAKLVLATMKDRFARLLHLWADGAYGGQLVAWVKDTFGWVLEIVKRNELHTFVVLPHRWVVERTFAWLTRWRRLNRHYERRTDTGEALVHVAMIGLMVRRLRWAG